MNTKFIVVGQVETNYPNDHIFRYIGVGSDTKALYMKVAVSRIPGPDHCITIEGDEIVLRKRVGPVVPSAIAKKRPRSDFENKLECVYNPKFTVCTRCYTSHVRCSARRCQPCFKANEACVAQSLENEQNNEYLECTRCYRENLKCSERRCERCNKAAQDCISRARKPRELKRRRVMSYQRPACSDRVTRAMNGHGLCSARNM